MITLSQRCTLFPTGRTYDTRVRCLPALGLQLFADMQHHIFILWMRHLLVDPEVVARLVIRLDRKVLGVCRVHPVDINIHFVDC